MFFFSGLVFSSCLATENEFVSVIPDPDSQKLSRDRIGLYTGVSCLLCILIVALILVKKVKI